MVFFFFFLLLFFFFSFSFFFFRLPSISPIITITITIVFVCYFPTGPSLLVLLSSPRALTDWTRAAWSLAAGYLSPLNTLTLSSSLLTQLLSVSQPLVIISHA